MKKILNQHNALYPSLSKLVRLQSGEKKNEIAIVIPSADSVELLEEHLGTLAKQDFLGFDVIIIGRRPRKAPRQLNVIIFSESFPLGSSGGFGIGQVLAYSMGYKYVINSDVDATPISKNLVSHLKRVAQSSGKAVFPRSVEHEGSKVLGGYVINQYGICPRRLLEEFGFVDFRFFKGAEDMDYCTRLLAENRAILDDSVLVRHKTHLVDIILLLKSQGNKYIYYKKSGLLGQIMLASYFVRRLQLWRAAGCFWEALVSAMKGQLLYSQYPDIYGQAVTDAIHFNMSSGAVGRTSSINEVKKPGKPLRLSLSSEHLGSGISFADDRTGLAGRASNLISLARAIFSQGDCFEPTEKFLYERVTSLPVLFLAKPIKYSDGKAYSSGLSRLGTAANAIKTIALAPYFSFSIAVSILKLCRSDYSIKTGNLDENLSCFAEYVKRLQAMRTGR